MNEDLQSKFKDVYLLCPIVYLYYTECAIIVISQNIFAVISSLERLLRKNIQKLEIYIISPFLYIVKHISYC